MPNKFWNIAKRECAVRINKPVFWILSLMGPVLLMILSIVPYAITSSMQEKRLILINAPVAVHHQIPLSIANYEVQLIDTSAAMNVFLNQQQQLLGDLHIGITDTLWTICAKERMHPSDSLNIVRTLSNIGPSTVALSSYVVNFKSEQEDSVSSPMQQTVALLASILVYFFLFTYSVSLLKGVMEEKSNKVMDIILSSVSPVTWIIGKITGVGLASFLQFVLWLGISYAPFYFFKQKYGVALDSFSEENIHASLQYAQHANINQAIGWYEWLRMIDSIHWLTLVVSMIIAMTLGFVLYAALFAIVGMIAGRESDSQPYVLPITSPLIFAFITSGAVIAEPYGEMAAWLSAIPFTAPVVLTLRAGLGVEFKELWWSFATLASSAALMVLFAGKIYKRILNQGGYLFRLKR